MTTRGTIPGEDSATAHAEPRRTLAELRGVFAHEPRKHLTLEPDPIPTARSTGEGAGDDAITRVGSEVSSSAQSEASDDNGAAGGESPQRETEGGENVDAPDFNRLERGEVDRPIVRLAAEIPDAVVVAALNAVLAPLGTHTRHYMPGSRDGAINAMRGVLEAIRDRWIDAERERCASIAEQAEMLVLDDKGSTKPIWGRSIIARAIRGTP